MRIVFRADASLEIGTGHVMRCLALANAMREHEAEVVFICRDTVGNLRSIINHHGFKVFMLPGEKSNAVDPEGAAHSSWLGVWQMEDAKQTCGVLRQVGVVDWLVVDHYGIDRCWESELRSAVGRIAAIDDLADRQHDCDVLLDQTYGRTSADYSHLVPAHTRLLLGAKYALLRSEFVEWRSKSLARIEEQRGSLRCIFVNFGGADASNTTGLVLDLIARIRFETTFEIIVVVGSGSTRVDKIKLLAEKLGMRIHVLSNVNNMAELMSRADLAIGAAGVTSWERCCLGLPAIVVVTADNQRLIAQALDEVGAILFVGTHEEVEKEPGRLSRPLSELVKNAQLLSKISEKAAAIVDGRGADRVAHTLLSYETVDEFLIGPYWEKGRG